ncbi:MAG: carboxypeptidase-like regulatory domain-containing protein, partial [Bacteroidales bacterium]|nr:carboxypeptidase-like regulatory domain-containing protein [Bacteroidales bacterium]
MRKLKLILAVLSLFAVSFANAQNITVKGTVTDQSGEPVIGVYVLLQGSSAGTSTDVDGRYEISAPANGTLEFTLVGMK